MFLRCYNLYIALRQRGKTTQNTEDSRKVKSSLSPGPAHLKNENVHCFTLIASGTTQQGRTSCGRAEGKPVVLWDLEVVGCFVAPCRVLSPLGFSLKDSVQVRGAAFRPLLTPPRH